MSAPSAIGSCALVGVALYALTGALIATGVMPW